MKKFVFTLIFSLFALTLFAFVDEPIPKDTENETIELTVSSCDVIAVNQFEIATFDLKSDRQFETKHFYLKTYFLPESNVISQVVFEPDLQTDKQNIFKLNSIEKNDFQSSVYKRARDGLRTI